MKALIRTKSTCHPRSGERIGCRLQACIPNMDARKMKKSYGGKVEFYATNEAVPSFRGDKLIAESMDYADENSISKADMERFLGQLVWKGYTEFEYLT